jgi:hypothetical protein
LDKLSSMSNLSALIFESVPQSYLKDSFSLSSCH